MLSVPSRNPLLRFENILAEIDAVRRYTKGMRKQVFMRNDLVADAVERCLLRIAEAATKLGDTDQHLAPGQPCQEIRSLGNRLRHDYDAVDRATIWSVVRNDLSGLLADCRRAIATLQKGKRGTAP